MSQPSDQDDLFPASSSAAGAGQTTTVEGAGALGWALLALLVILGLTALGFVFLYGRTSAPQLPRLSLEPLSAQEPPISLDDLRGQVVLLNFWGTWCPPCVKEFPDIVEVEKHYRGRDDFRLLAVSCGSAGDEPAKMAQVRVLTQSFLEQRFVDLPVYLDPDERTRQAVREVVEFPGYPTTILLDRQHRVRGHWIGPVTMERLREAIDQVLNAG